MKKSELSVENIERINFAIKKGLGSQNWQPISLLSGGLTNIPVYKIEAENNLYAIKLENVDDKNFDLVRNYKIIEKVAEQGISPPVYFTDAERGIILMKYIKSKPRPEASPSSVQEFVGVIRKLHDNNSFSKWKSVIDIFNYYYEKLTFEYLQNRIIKKCMQEICTIEDIVFDPNDIRSSHCDLNPANVLFDGKSYFLVDWQAASPQSFYFDLANCANWFYFYNEELCASVLTDYLGREATEEEKAKYYLMRIFTNIYFGIGFISLPLKAKPDFQVLNDSDIEQLPTYLSFMQSIGSGLLNLADANTQQRFGFVFLKTAEEMMNQKYNSACELLTDIDNRSLMNRNR